MGAVKYLTAKSTVANVLLVRNISEIFSAPTSPIFSSFDRVNGNVK